MKMKLYHVWTYWRGVRNGHALRRAESPEDAELQVGMWLACNAPEFEYDRMEIEECEAETA